MQRPILRILFTILLALIGLVFTAGMRAFGLAFSGGGMGSRLFHFLVAGPEGLCLLIWPVLFPLLPWTRQPKIAITVLSLALIPILWAGIVLTGEGIQDDVVKEIWQKHRPVIYIFATLYLFPSFLGFVATAKSMTMMVIAMRKAKLA
jgi:hypothetical protein